MKHSDPSLGPYSVFIAILSIISIALVLGDVLIDPSAEAARAIRHIDNALCTVFLLDFCGRLITAPSKLAYLKWGWIDLISSIPTVAAFRFGRLFRVARVLRLLRGVRLGVAFASMMRTKRAEGLFASVASLAVVMLVFGSVAILTVETAPDSNIQTAEDAIWWSIVTMTTVGYGDHYPATTEGRVIAGLLMVFGIAVFGTFTALVASWFDEQDEEQMEAKLDQMMAAIQRLEDQVQSRSTPN